MARPANAHTERPTAPAAKLTGRGAVLGMAVIFTVGLLVASWLGVTMLAGIFFVAGSALAAWYTRPADLLTVVLVPPILFSGALIFVEVLTASGSLVLSVAAGGVVTLASVAPWLAAGLVLTVAIAWARGLPQCFRDLRRDLRAERARRAPARAAGASALGSRSVGALLRLVRAEPAGPGSKGPGNGRATRPQEPVNAKAAGPAASRGPGTKSAGHPPRARQTEPDAPGNADEAAVPPLGTRTARISPARREG